MIDFFERLYPTGPWSTQALPPNHETVPLVWANKMLRGVERRIGREILLAVASDIARKSGRRGTPIAQWR